MAFSLEGLYLSGYKILYCQNFLFKKVVMGVKNLMLTNTNFGFCKINVILVSNLRNHICFLKGRHRRNVRMWLEQYRLLICKIMDLRGLNFIFLIHEYLALRDFINHILRLFYHSC